MKEEEFSVPDTDLFLPGSLREKLKETLGPVVSDDLPSKYREKEPVVTVGDVVTDVLLEQGMIPDLALYDGKTRRGEYRSETRRELEEIKTVKLENPAERITVEAWKTIEKGLNMDEPLFIEVDGEEDLLSLPCIMLCPKGGIVIYGIPGEGMVINEVNDYIKSKTWEVINKMKKVNDG